MAEVKLKVPLDLDKVLAVCLKRLRPPEACRPETQIKGDLIRFLFWRVSLRERVAKVDPNIGSVIVMAPDGAGEEMVAMLGEVPRAIWLVVLMAVNVVPETDPPLMDPVTFPVRFAVMVPAEKFPEPSRSTSDVAVLAVS